MIVVDTSALMAILLCEPEADACVQTLEEADTLLISAATLAEALIVAGGRNLAVEMAQLIEGLGFEAVSVSAAQAKKAAECYAMWGKGFHAARLNFGDCFAYQLAQERQCPLLFVGNDFAQTDVRCALQTI